LKPFVLVLIKFMPFRNKKEFARRIQSDIIRSYTTKKSDLENQGTKDIQDAVEFLKVVDTKHLKANSNMELFAFASSVVFRFQTLNTPYDFAPRNGLGSSRKYGPRKYDVLGASRFIKRLANINLKVSDVGKPRKK